MTTLEYYDHDKEAWDKVATENDYCFCYEKDSDTVGVIVNSNGGNMIEFTAEMLCSLRRNISEEAVVLAIKSYLEQFGEGDFA